MKKSGSAPPAVRCGCRRNSTPSSNPPARSKSFPTAAGIHAAAHSSISADAGSRAKRQHLNVKPVE